MLDARSCASTGRKDVVREVKGIEKMSMLGAGRGARERGGGVVWKGAAALRYAANLPEEYWLYCVLAYAMYI